MNFKGIPARGDYNVLATDYDSYSLVYSCSGLLGFGKTEYVWILSREPTLSDSKIAQLLDLVEERVGYGRDSLVFPDQSDCGWQ